MSFFKTKEEKEQKKHEKELKKESSLSFFGKTLQPIGKIPMNELVTLNLDSENKKLVIFYTKEIKVSLPYERIRGFKIDNEVNLSKSGGTLGRALAGGLLFGGAGAIVGGMSGKGKTEIRWFGTLSYLDKEGSLQELNFIQYSLTGEYRSKDKHWGYGEFEKAVNKIVSRFSEDIEEL